MMHPDVCAGIYIPLPKKLVTKVICFTIKLTPPICLRLYKATTRYAISLRCTHWSCYLIFPTTFPAVFISYYVA